MLRFYFFFFFQKTDEPEVVAPLPLPPLPLPLPSPAAVVVVVVVVVAPSPLPLPRPPNACMIEAVPVLADASADDADDATPRPLPLSVWMMPPSRRPSRLPPLPPLPLPTLAPPSSSVNLGAEIEGPS